MTARRVERWVRSDASMERARVYDRKRSKERTKLIKAQGLCRTCASCRPTNGTRVCDRCKLKAACRLVGELARTSPEMLTQIRSLCLAPPRRSSCSAA